VSPLARRFLVLGAAHASFLGASPGVLAGDGSTLLAVVAIALWASGAARPLGERRGLGLFAEWITASAGACGRYAWAAYVTVPGALWMGAGTGLYLLLAGFLLRRLVRRGLPLAFAVPLAWVGVETLRTFVPPPFGIGWLVLGHAAHHHTWLSGAARVVGPEGLGLTLACAAGALAEAARRRSWRALVPLPVAVALPSLLAVVVRPPETAAGPRLLLVQPGFTQERKQYDDPRENFLALRRLTLEALSEPAGSSVDLVCWGESMLYVPLFEEGLERALARGVRPPPWDTELDAGGVRAWRRVEDGWIRGGLFGVDAPEGSTRLPEGVALLAGAEVYRVVDGQVRRTNAAVLYGPDGERRTVAGKRFLVPGAETMFGLERYEGVRAVVERAAGYVPDFVPAERTGVAELATRDGRTHRIGVSVCFDNGFLEPYVDPVRDGPLDFHLVVSNEAWYRESHEMDQMVALSRIAAIATGRSLVRATNSGVSLGLGPGGEELGRVRGPGGKDRAVPGTLALEVPVPAAGGRTPYVVVRSAWRLAIVLAPVGLLVLRRRRPEPPGEGLARGGGARASAPSNGP